MCIGCHDSVRPRSVAARKGARAVWKSCRTDGCNISSLRPPPSLTLPFKGGGNRPGVAHVEAGHGAPRHEIAVADTPSPSLTERVRALYEESVVPVREIARLAGVTERMIYKYARKRGWVPRVTRLSRDGTAAGLAARGARARFIPREEAGKPVASGLKATDSAGAITRSRRPASAPESFRMRQLREPKPTRSCARPAPRRCAMGLHTSVRANCFVARSWNLCGSTPSGRHR